MTTKDLTSYVQALDFQAALVRRGLLAGDRTHELADDTYETVVGTICVHCTCGEWLQYPAEKSERLYTVGHIGRELRKVVAA